MRILLVEDEKKLADMVARGLKAERYAVDVSYEGQGGWDLAAAYEYDLIILDLMLPGLGGTEILRRVRRKNQQVPILILTARDATAEKVQNFEAGADDYLTKPFAFRELLARVRALGRRRGAPLPETLRVADLEVDLEAHRVRRAGKSIELTAKEFALLEFFVLHPGQVVDRAAITAHVWDENHDPFTNVLEVLVRRLRRKIDDDYPTKLIQTVRGAGYRLGD
jgi:DNA-binding response OmpR family regulator